MAKNVFGRKKYATLEMNRAGYLKNGLIVSQLPLGTAFTDDDPCENGMWVDADKANGAINAPSANTAIYGIVYTTEKEYNDGTYGMNQFHQVAGDYPRVGVMQPGDTFTSNCFQYDTTAYTDEAAVKAALVAATLASTPQYLKPVAGSARPELTATKPTAGFYGRVIKATTMPNGEYAIKYNIVSK